MPSNKIKNNKELLVFLNGKSEHTLNLFYHFIEIYQAIGEISIEPKKSMIGISNSKKKIAWVTQLGKNFIHVVFPFKKEFKDNLCFIKIAEVPGNTKQFNHHLRILQAEDINGEVVKFMKMAYKNTD